MRAVLLYLSSVVFGGAGAWVISRWGSILGVLDRANHRSSHDGVVPKGGGIGILGTFVFCAWLLGFPYLVWISVGVMSLFSLYGDRREIPPKVRLCVQFVVTVGLLVGLLYWGDRGWVAYLLIPLFSVFVVGTANYYNFMDGINGIAGITGVVGFGLVALFLKLTGGNEVFATLAICMGLACLSFLPFNMPKAQVFMGDVGSVLLGFVYGGFVVGLSHGLNDFVVLCSFLFPFYADELITEHVRLRDGENLLEPHRRHVYQLLANEMGIAHWKVSVWYGVLQTVVGVGGLMIRGYGIWVLMGYLGVWFVGFCCFGAWVRRSADSKDKMIHAETSSHEEYIRQD